MVSLSLNFYPMSFDDVKTGVERVIGIVTNSLKGEEDSPTAKVIAELKDALHREVTWYEDRARQESDDQGSDSFWASYNRCNGYR